MKKINSKSGAIVLLLAVYLISCKREEIRIEPELPINPYSLIDYGTDPDEIPIDSSSFLGLQTYIFSTSCAVPGCHDGSFEPDFRNIQSTYNTLVFHEVLKNNAEESFTYRVLPNDTTNSWLHERITTDDSVLGKMPLYDKLTSVEIKRIENWIMSGAPDLFGNLPKQANYQPSTFGILAYENDRNGTRIDQNRETQVSPLVLSENTMVELWFGLFDSNENGDFLPALNFTENRIAISEDLLDYSNATIDQLSVESSLTPFMAPIPFGNSAQLAPYYHSYVINTVNFSKDKTYYLRVYVKDADHIESTEIPENGSQIYLMTYFSFIIQ